MSRPSWDDFQKRRAALAVSGETPAMICARVFGSADGAKLMTYLRSITKERVLGPDASSSALAYLEGQRHLVAHVEALIDEGAREPVKE